MSNKLRPCHELYCVATGVYTVTIAGQDTPVCFRHYPHPDTRTGDNTPTCTDSSDLPATVRNTNLEGKQT